MSNSGFTQLSPCWCSAYSAFQSAVTLARGWGLLLSLWNWKGTMRFWDECGHSEVVVGTGFLGALREQGAQEGCSPPSRVTESQQSSGPSSLQPAPHWRMSLWPGWVLRKVQINKGKKQLWPTLHLPQTAPAHHYPCVFLAAPEEFKWNSKVRSLPVGKQHCALTTMDYRRKHRLVQKQNSSKKKKKDGRGAWGLGETGTKLCLVTE